MKKRTLIVLLGIFIIIVPVLGLPSSWKNKIIMVSGATVAFMAATKRRSLSVPVAANEESASEPMPVAIKKPRKPRTVKVSVSGETEVSPSTEASAENSSEKDNA